MKVLIAGGIKTQNIVDGLERKFTSGGVDFLVVPFIEDIENIYYRGEYFDRALIIEQCWNRDFELTDESTVRHKINDFAHKASLRDTSNVSFIFLTQTKEAAEIVSEEILNIRDASVIVVKKPRYSVSFFTTLVTSDLDKIPEELVYTEEIPEVQVEIEEDIEEHIEIPDYRTKDIDNIEDDLFGKSMFDDIKLDKNYQSDDLDKDDLFDTNINLDETPEIEDTEEILEDDVEELYEIEVEMDEEETPEMEDITGDINIHDQIEDTEDYEEDTFENTFEDDFNNTFDDIDLFSDGDYKEDNNGDNSQNNVDDDEYHNEPIFIDEDEYDDSYIPDNTSDKASETLRKDMTNEQLRATLDAFAARGNSIVVTGCGGCGTSLVAFNLANTIVNLGYTCLLVDMDVENRAQSYISKDNYESMDSDSSSIVSAINSSSGVTAHMAITRQGFHLLTMGMAGEVKPIDKVIHREKLNRFTTLVRNSHNFVIYDIPFKTATDFAQDITFTADNIVLVVDSSNWGVGKTMLSVCNIESDEMQDNIFSRSQLLFNRYRGLNRVFGRKVKSAIDIVRAVDKKVLDLIGEDTGYYFEDMHICGVINEDQAVEEGWFSSKPYSETPQGQIIFTELLCNIVMKR